MEEPDVIVVGAGTAGLCAAVAAALAGAGRVLVLEKGDRAEAGGNSFYSHTGFRAPYDAGTIEPFIAAIDPERRRRLVLPGHSVEAFAADLDSATGGRMDPSIRDRFAARAAPTMEWMRQLGIPWTLNRSLQQPDGEHFEPGMILAAGGGGGGRALAESWMALGAPLGVEVVFEAPVVGIRLDAALGHVVTIGGAGPMAGTTVRAPSLIAAAGGFQASAERRVRLMGPAYRSVAVRGTAHDTGEVLEMLLAEGAGRDGTWQDAVVSPIDAEGPAVSGGQDLNRYSWPWGITVDRNGRRFFDEGADHANAVYGSVGRAIVEWAGDRAFQVFDATGMRYIKTYAYQHGIEHRADSIRGLAAATGIDPDGLDRTVAEFNQSVVDDRPFDPTILDGRHTAGIDPPKSNWATRLETPPFVAYGVRGGLTFTLGGLRIDPDARVLDEAGSAIPGLFATGDILGIFHGGYPGGSGQTRNVVFGKLAGEGAAAWARAAR